LNGSVVFGGAKKTMMFLMEKKLKRDLRCLSIYLMIFCGVDEFFSMRCVSLIHSIAYFME
jgi:hypothetical protein